jgi:hypothetical protein
MRPFLNSSAFETTAAQQHQREGSEEHIQAVRSVSVVDARVTPLSEVLGVEFLACSLAAFCLGNRLRRRCDRHRNEAKHTRPLQNDDRIKVRHDRVELTLRRCTIPNRRWVFRSGIRAQSGRVGWRRRQHAELRRSSSPQPLVTAQSRAAEDCFDQAE